MSANPSRVKMLTQDELSNWLRIPVATLETMRSRPGRDPIPFVKAGRLVRYREDHVWKWIERNTFDNTEDSFEHRGTGTKVG